MPKSAAKIPFRSMSPRTRSGSMAIVCGRRGVELDVLTAIKNGATTAAQMASSAGANDSAMRRLLDTLVSLK